MGGKVKKREWRKYDSVKESGEWKHRPVFLYLSSFPSPFRLSLCPNSSSASASPTMLNLQSAPGTQLCHLHYWMLSLSWRSRIYEPGAGLNFGLISAVECLEYFWKSFKVLIVKCFEAVVLNNHGTYAFNHRQERFSCIVRIWKWKKFRAGTLCFFTEGMRDIFQSGVYESHEQIKLQRQCTIKDVKRDTAPLQK